MRRGLPVMPFQYSNRGGHNKGRRKVGRYYLLYTVYRNDTDELVILDGNAVECARAMGVSEKSFYSMVTRARSGRIKRWHIEAVPAETLLSG